MLWMGEVLRHPIYFLPREFVVQGLGVQYCVMPRCCRRIQQFDMFSSGISAEDSVSGCTRLVDVFKLLIPGLGLSTPSGLLVCVIYALCPIDSQH